MSEHCNITQVLYAFVKGHVEAILAIVGHSYYQAVIGRFCRFHLEGTLLTFCLLILKLQHEASWSDMAIPRAGIDEFNMVFVSVQAPRGPVN